MVADAVRSRGAAVDRLYRVLRRAATALLAGVIASAGAATVSLHPGGNLVVLEGRIDVGDFDKVLKLSREATPTGIYLASPGGNLVEAIRIGALVRRLAWETRSAEGPGVPAEFRAGVAASYGVRDPARHNICASACFLIFVGGIYRDGHQLALHQPFISPAELERITPEEAVRRASNVRTLVEAYLRRMGVPLRYVQEMYDVPKERLRWLTEEEIATDFHGFIAEVRPWVETQCSAEEVQTQRCRDSVMTGIRIRALQEANR